jgi:hypothetical protein
MKTVPALLADAVSQVLDDGVDAVDEAAAGDLLTTAMSWSRSRAAVSMTPIGPLRPIVEVTREAVRARADQLFFVRWTMGIPACDAATSLRTLLNVMLAEGAADRAERRYADTARAAMVAAVIADLRGDQRAVDAQRDALTAAARDALTALKSGAELNDVAPAVSAAELMRAELRSRLRGEVPTTSQEAWTLRLAVCCLVDNYPEDSMPYGQDGGMTSAIYEIHRDVKQRLVQLHTARREFICDRPVPRNATTIGELLAWLLLVVISADAVAAIGRTYADAEAQAVALTAIAHLRGDTAGVEAQLDVLRDAAATVVRQLGDPNAPVDPKTVENLLLTQLA